MCGAKDCHIRKSFDFLSLSRLIMDELNLDKELVANATSQFMSELSTYFEKFDCQLQR